jgi:hypothetical protein
MAAKLKREPESSNSGGRLLAVVKSGNHMDKAAIICKLHQIADHYLLGVGTWPADRESLLAFSKTVRDLGLDEDVPDSPAGTTRATPLGKELKLDLVMAFVGAWDMWEIPYVLHEYGYIDETVVKMQGFSRHRMPYICGMTDLSIDESLWLTGSHEPGLGPRQ